MQQGIESIHKDMEKIFTELNLIRNILKEDFELSDGAVRELKESRQRPDSELIEHKEAKKRVLGR